MSTGEHWTPDMTPSAALPWLLVAGAAVLAGRPSAGTRRVDPDAAGRLAERPRRRSHTGLLRSPLAAVVAFAGAAIAVAGWRWGGGIALVAAPLLLRRMRSAVPVRSGSPVDDDRLPLALDLLAAVVRSGRPTADALEIVADVAPTHRDLFLRIGAGLRLGAAPAEAWSEVPRDGPLAAVARVVARSGQSGARFAAVLEQEAAAMRTADHARRLAAAHRAGVTLLAPLGACFLPAFVAVGVVPVIAGVLASTRLGLP